MKPIVYIGIIFGIFLIFASIFAATYTERKWHGAFGIGYWETIQPYKQYSFPLAILGIFSIIVGIAFTKTKNISDIK